MFNSKGFERVSTSIFGMFRIKILGIDVHIMEYAIDVGLKIN